MILIGTSGFQYKEWKGDFYPERLPAAKMLAYYAQRFPTTEINYTFRQLPSDKTLANWLAQTPEQFRFTLKALRQITEYKRLKNCEELLGGLVKAAMKLGPKRGALLFQLPPQFKCDVAVLSDFLALLPPSVVAAFEFRDTSWFTDAVFDVLRRHNTALCIADSEKLTTPTVSTGTTGYFRLRRVNYTSAELRRWADAIREQSSRMTDIYIYLKHEDTGTGPRLANELMKMLGVKPPTAETREGELPLGE